MTQQYLTVPKLSSSKPLILKEITGYSSKKVPSNTMNADCKTDKENTHPNC